MKTKLILLLFLTPLVLSAQSILTYAGNQGREAFYDVVQLSDGTILVAGFSENMDWIDSNVPIREIPLPHINNSQGTNVYPFLIQFSTDLSQMIQVLRFPQGSAENIRYIKTTNLPGQATGTIYVSGDTEDSRNNDGGYFIARLNNNFVNGVPNAVDFAHGVWAEGYVKENHPWDVDQWGEVTYVRGQSHDYDWSAMYRLNDEGIRMVVENWQMHWVVGGGEHRGTASTYAGGIRMLEHSGMVFKRDNRCCFRSQTQADYDLMSPDGNGGIKKGKWPLDAFFDSPCTPGVGPTAGPGYTGYRTGGTSIYGPQSIVTDRRTGNVFLGMNIKSVLPDGNPDFEPAVMAFDPSGSLLWWSRLYHEIRPAGDTVNSTPDQYIDGLAIDYSDSNAVKLVVAARCHGNNIENLWEGDEIAANPNANAFQNRFTGTNGNIHISWLGKLKVANGDLSSATYVAEYVEGSTSYGAAHPDPNLSSWPNPNAGWPNVNTTRLARNNLKATADGSVCIIGTGRRTITTANAHQQMPIPSSGLKGSWNEFVRMYTPDFEKPTYSSLITGVWDTLTGQGGGNTDLYGVWKVADGVLVVGRHKASGGIADGENIPSIGVPAWGKAIAENESALIGYLKATELENPDDGWMNNTSISDEFANQISIFPNPTEGIIYIEGLNKEGEIQLLDVNGSLLLTKNIKQEKTEIDLSKLPDAVYMLQLFSKNKQLIHLQKVVKW